VHFSSHSNNSILKFCDVPHFFICICSLQIDLGDNHSVLHSSCQCALGVYECHHVAAALLYGYARVIVFFIRQVKLFYLFTLFYSLVCVHCVCQPVCQG